MPVNYSITKHIVEYQYRLLYHIYTIYLHKQQLQHIIINSSMIIVNKIRISFSSLYTVNSCTKNSDSLDTCTAVSASRYVESPALTTTSGTTYSFIVQFPQTFIHDHLGQRSQSSVKAKLVWHHLPGFKLNWINYLKYNIQSATVSTSSLSNGATSTWTISIPLSNKIPAYGKIALTFQPLTKQYLYYGVSDTTAQQVLQTSSTFTCKYASSTTSCSASKLTVTTSSSSVLITFSSTVLASGGTLQILIANAKNPVSAQPFTGLTMITYDNSYIIDTYTLTTGVTTSAASITGTTSNIYNQKTLISDTNAEYYFQFTTTNPLPKESYMEITVSSGITLPSSFSSWDFKAYDVEISGVTFSASGQVLTVKNFISTYTKGGTDYYFTITGWTNPSTTTSATFSIVTYEKSSGTAYAIDQISGFSIQAALGAIYVLTMKPTDNKNVLEYPTNYTIEIQCKNSFATTDYLEIIFPSEFEIADSSACTVSGFYQLSTTCASSSYSRTITIKKLSTSSIGSMNTIIFTVNKIRNPPIYDKSNQIIFNHKSSAALTIDNGKYYMPKNTYTSSYISTFKVTPGSTQAGGKGLTYQFQISPAAFIPIGSQIVILLPGEISIYSSSNIEFKCGGTLSGFTSSSVLCAVKSSTKIVVQKGFASAKSVNDPPTLSFTIPSLNNPRSLEPSSLFGCQILDSSGRVLYIWNDTTSPQVTMKTAGVPSKFVLSRSSTVNSALSNYIFNITPSLYYQDTDILKIVAPTSVLFSNSSTCKGLIAVASTLSCTKSADLKSIEIKIATSRLRNLAQISSGTLISINITNVQNPISTKMTTSGFSVYTQTKNGYIIEQSTSGPYVVNSQAADLDYNTANVQPSNYIASKSAVYTFQFKTTGFQQNMKIKVTLPTQINFDGSTVKCKGIHGVDKQNLTCVINTGDKSFSISDAFSVSEIAPSNITFSVDSLKNPTNREVTSSFKIETFTSDNYAIDKLTANLEINFFCVYPCKTCNQSNSSQCFSCYNFVSEKYFFQSQCFETCPTGYYNTDKNISTCEKCNSPCAKCKTTADLCTSCIDKYILGGNGQCYEKVIIANIYPFPFSAFAIFATFSALITKCFAKKTKFLQSAIALCAFPEIISWVAATFMLASFGIGFSSFLTLIGSCIHVLINFTYCLLHQRIFLRKSDQKYIDFFKTHNNCNKITLIVAFLFTFKFHMISLSHCANGEHLKGSWNKFQWLLWNSIVILYIITSCAPMVFGCIYEILMAPQKMYTFTWYMTIDCIIVTVYMAILLIILLVRYAPCIISRRKNKALLYNRVENENSLLNDDQNQHTKLNIQKLNEIDKEQGKFEKQIDTDEGDARTRRRETNQNEEQAEIEQLQNFIKQLEKESLIIEPDERKEIIDERSKILQEKDQKLLQEQPEELREVKEEFLQGVDKRVSLKIEPWEISQEPEPIMLPIVNPVSDSLQYEQVTSNEIGLRIPKAVSDTVFNYYEQLFQNERGLIMPKASFEKIKLDEIQGFSNEYGGRILPQRRVFEIVEYDIQENEQKDTDDDLDEIEMKDEVNEEDIRRNNVLYSDKSESSIDDMMEDTPSNYNIPNGRLDGKSLGLKALLLQAKKQGIKLDVEKTATGQKLVGNNNPLTKPPRVKQEEEKKFVNNLFRNSNDLGQPAGRSNNLNTNNSLKQDSLENTGGNNDNNSTLEFQEKGHRKKKKVQNQKQFKESPEQDKSMGMFNKNATQDMDPNKRSSKMLSKSPARNNNNEDLGKVKANNFF